MRKWPLSGVLGPAGHGGSTCHDLNAARRQFNLRDAVIFAVILQRARGNC